MGLKTREGETKCGVKGLKKTESKRDSRKPLMDPVLSAVQVDWGIRLRQLRECWEQEAVSRDFGETVSLETQES